MASSRSWDASVLGLSVEDVEAMDAEERAAAALDALHRAADLLEASSKAFAPEYGARKQVIRQAARELDKLARELAAESP